MTLSPNDIARLRELVSDATFTTRFAIEREIGVGGMGRVFVGTEKGTERKIALKLLDPGLQGDPERFAAEAEMLERLDHPAIVSYIAHGMTADGRPYLAMTWLEGEALSARLERGPLPVIEAVRIGARIAGALAYLHERKIVHRDIKPSNVFLVGNDPGSAVVIDLGIAKQLDATQKLTRTGQLIGTPGYMAPEQVMGEATIDGRVDLFALGCLLHESIAGEMPFPGDAVMEVLARLLLHDPKRLDTIDPSVPPRLAIIVALLLAKEASARTIDAATVEAELVTITTALAAGDTKALAESPFKAPVLGTAATLAGEAPTLRERPAPAPAPLPQAKGSRWIPVVAVFAPMVAVVLIGGLIINARGEAEAPKRTEKISVTPVATGPIVLPAEAIVAESTPAPAQPGHVVEAAAPGLVGVDMVAATWCETGKRAVTIGSDGRIYTVDHATVAPHVASPAVIADPAAAILACTPGGLAVIAAAGRMFAIDPGALLARDELAVTLPANVVDAVAVGPRVRFAAPGGVWEWSGGSTDAPKKLFDACGDPKRLSPEGGRVACRRNGEIIVDDHGKLEVGPKGQTARWLADGKSLIVDQGSAQHVWRLGTPPDRSSKLELGHDIIQVGAWLVAATGKTIARHPLRSRHDALVPVGPNVLDDMVSGMRAAHGVPGAMKLPATIYDILAVVPSAHEVLVNCQGRLRFAAFEQAELAAIAKPARVMALAFDPGHPEVIASVDDNGEITVRTPGSPRVVFPERAEYVSSQARLTWRTDGTLVLGGSLMLDAWTPDHQHRKLYEGSVDTHGISATTGVVTGTDDIVRASQAGIEIANLDGGAARSLTTSRLPDLRSLEVDRTKQYAVLDSTRNARLVKLPGLESVIELAEFQHERMIHAFALIAGEPPALVVADSFDNVFAITGGTVRPLAHRKTRVLAGPATGRRVAVGSGRDVIVFDVDSGLELFRGALDTPVSAIAWDRTSTKLAAAGYATELRYFDVP
ncbi:MAG: serine/threonine-protein kinase [Kofleriaceae bacterium]